MNKKRLIITSSISIILVAILLIGSTYSVFTSSEIDENTNVYKTGILDVTYTLSEDNVSFSNTTPMTEEEADSITPYRITVTNAGTVPYMFDVILTETTASNAVDSKYIMTKIGYTTPKRLSECTDNKIREDIIVPAGESVDIDVRVWLSDDVKNSEMGKNFYAKLEIDGEAIIYEDKTVDNDMLSLKYMKETYKGEKYHYHDIYYKEDAYREKIKTASFVDYINLDNAVIDEATNKKISWDLSEKGDNSVVAWLEQNTTVGFYDLYIGATQKIYAKTLEGLFYELKILENVSFDNLDTSLVTNMYNMFYYAGADATTWEIDLSGWDTSSVTNMSWMFDGAGENATTWSVGDLSGWDTSSVTTMVMMFSSAGENATTWSVGDLSGWDTSSVTDMSWMFSSAGENATTWSVGDLSGWDTSSVTDMSYMFSSTGYNATTWEIDLSGWDTSSVTDMSHMFSSTGYNATTWSVGDLSGWDTSSVTTMESMFQYAGEYATTWEIDLSGWDTSSVTTMKYMFRSAGEYATTWEIDLNGWDTSSVTTMESMFQYAGKNALTFNIEGLSGWDTSSVTTMETMFYYAGKNATTWEIDLSGWDTSSVTTMESMFYYAGDKATTWSVGDLSGWDTSSVTNMSSMFRSAGSGATTWSVGDLGGWDTSSVTDMSYMFHTAGYNAETFELDLSGWNTGKVENMSYMFNGCRKLTTIYVSDKWSTASVTISTNMFYRCTSLVGGAGTTYSDSHVGATYAHIDGGTSNPGYFTAS